MFTPVKSQKVYEKVVEQIKDMIKTGQLKCGDKLPPERDLGEKLQVSRTSIREIIRSLEIMGLVESRQGEGNFIKDSFSKSLLEPLSVMFLLQGGSKNDILELRKAIEMETVLLAAKRIDDEDLKDIYSIIFKLKENQDEKNNAELDKEFHYKIAKASNNFLLVNILDCVSSLIDAFISGARISILKKNADKEILVKQHEKIYEALRNHNAEEAVIAMNEHLELIDKSII